MKIVKSRIKACVEILDLFLLNNGNIWNYYTDGFLGCLQKVGMLVWGNVEL